MVKINKITIKWSEGSNRYCAQFPKEFNSFEEINAFFMANAYSYTEGGYYKHGIVAEWENGETYEYRGDLSSPKGNCYCSLEYFVERRIKQACFHRIKMFNEGNKCWGDTTETITEVKRFLETMELGGLSESELENIMALDKSIREENQRIKEEKEEFAQYTEMKRSMFDATEVEPAKNEKTMELNGYTVRYASGKEGYIVIEGEEKNTKHNETYKIRRVYRVGDEAITYEYGTTSARIRSITEKNVVLEGDFYKTKSKREEIKWFVSTNRNYMYERSA